MEDFSKYNGDGTLLRQMQLTMLHILIEVDCICRRHGIPYALEGGTCLGAVRHKGFIPWDDDLDILVWQKDLERLREILPKELPNDLVYQDETTEPHYHMKLAKVRDRYSVIEECVPFKFKEKGIFIDIIPYEHVVAFPIKNAIDFVYIRCLRGIRGYTDVWYEIALGYVCYPFVLMAAAMCRFWTKIFPTKQVGHVYGWKSYKHMPEDYIFPPKEIEFEGHSFMGPNNPHAFLTALFGNYMQIPPEEKRETHTISIQFAKGKKSNL